MSTFFNGQEITSPSVNSAVNDRALIVPNAAGGNNLGLIGSCTGGKAGAALTFTSPDAAAAVLGSGPLVDAIKRAFAPSPEAPSPARILVSKVNNATPSTLTLFDANGITAVAVTSSTYGLKSAQTKIKVEAGSLSGRKITTQLGSGAPYSADNVGRAALTVAYTGGQASATVAVAGAAVTLSAPTGSAVATIDLNAYGSVQALVDRINAQPGFAAAVLDSNPSRSVLGGLDAVAGAQLGGGGAVTLRADLAACVEYLNSAGSPLTTAARVSPTAGPPALSAYTYLAGGTEGTTTYQDWSNALAVFQNADVQWMVPLTNDPAVHAMVEGHVAYMSTTGRKERRAIVGAPLGTTDAQARQLAASLNHDRVSLTHLGGYDYNDAGALTLFGPEIVAAMIGGLMAGLPPGEPGTNKSLNLRGMERQLNNPGDTDALIKGGVLCVEVTAEGTVKVVQSISTWLNDSGLNRVEISCGAALDFTIKAVRKGLLVLKGAKGDATILGRAISIADTVLTQCAKPAPAGPGTIVGDANSPAYKGLSAVFGNTATAVSFQCSPAGPNNFVNITVFAQPYSGSASA